MSNITFVSSSDELLAALNNPSVDIIDVEGTITGLESFTLLANQTLQGDDDSLLEFAPGQNGICCTQENLIQNITIAVDADQKAIFNDTSVEHLGTISLRDVTTIGQVKFIAADAVISGHIDIDQLDVVYAETAQYVDRVQGYGAFVLQGALTIWNMQPDMSVMLTAQITGFSTGSASQPTAGSGLVVSGTGINGGKVSVGLIHTYEIHNAGYLAEGTLDTITGAMSILNNVYVDEIINTAPMTTYTQNDHVLINWGYVDTWSVDDKITSYGHSGAAFTNYGHLHDLSILAPIETFGEGANGLNFCDGILQTASLDRVVTHGNGAIGVHVVKAIGQLHVDRGIETFGGTGTSVVRGELLDHVASGLNVLAGGSIRNLDVKGGITTHIQGISAFVNNGIVSSLRVKDGINTLNSVIAVA